MILLASGPASQEPSLDLHTRTNLEIARLMLGIPSPGRNPPPAVSSHVLASNFWLLSASSPSKEAGVAWFQPDGRALPVVQALTRLRNGCEDKEAISADPQGPETRLPFRPIQHYVLLPKDSQMLDPTIGFLRSMIDDQHPTLGFSLEEAVLAERVSVAGDETTFPEDVLGKLRIAGCMVDRLNIDGTSIATNG
jgi:hypothetical protein